MNTIKDYVGSEIIINKSRFITLLLYVENEIEVKNILNQTKEKYNDATHICYAFILNNNKRFNDDGEPGGTAGVPILNALEKNNLENVLCIVIRYFGGIKLGAGGLIRAYTKSVTTTLKIAEIIPLSKGTNVELIFDYDNIKTIDNILKNEVIKLKNFNDLVEYIIWINNDNINDIINKLKKICLTINILDETYNR